MNQDYTKLAEEMNTTLQNLSKVGEAGTPGVPKSAASGKSMSMRNASNIAVQQPPKSSATNSSFDSTAEITKSTSTPPSSAAGTVTSLSNPGYGTSNHYNMTTLSAPRVTGFATKYQAYTRIPEQFTKQAGNFVSNTPNGGQAPDSYTNPSPIAGNPTIPKDRAGGDVFETASNTFGTQTIKQEKLTSAAKALDCVASKLASYSTHPEEDVFRRMIRRRGEQALVDGDRDTAVKMAAAMNALDMLPEIVADENMKFAAAGRAMSFLGIDPDTGKQFTDNTSETTVDDKTAGVLGDIFSVTTDRSEEPTPWWSRTSFILPGVAAVGGAALALSPKLRNKFTTKVWTPLKEFAKNRKKVGKDLSKADMLNELMKYKSELSIYQNAKNVLEAANETIKRKSLTGLISDLKYYDRNQTWMSKPEVAALLNKYKGFPPEQFAKQVLTAIEPEAPVWARKLNPTLLDTLAETENSRSGLTQWMKDVANKTPIHTTRYPYGVTANAQDANALRARRAEGAFSRGLQEWFREKPFRNDLRAGLTAGLGTAAVAAAAPSVDTINAVASRLGAGDDWIDPNSTGARIYSNFVKHPISTGLAVGLLTPMAATHMSGLKQSVEAPVVQLRQNVASALGGGLLAYKAAAPTEWAQDMFGRKNRHINDSPVLAPVLGGVAGAGLGLGGAYLANRLGGLDLGVDDYTKYTLAGAGLGAGTGYAANSVLRNYRRSTRNNLW